MATTLSCGLPPCRGERTPPRVACGTQAEVRSQKSVEVEDRSTSSQIASGPACSKVGARADAASSQGDLLRIASTVSLRSLEGESREGRKRTAEFLLSSSDSEGESNKRSRGRPALNPEHVGKFTAEVRAKKTDKTKARQLQRDYHWPIDPEVDSSSTSAKRAREKAVELALEYDEQPLCAIAAVATRELGTIVKAVEKSKNIKDDIVRDLWKAHTKLSAALSSVVTRAGDGDLAVDGADRSGFGAWEEEKRKLEREVLLRSRNTFLERNRDRGRSTSHCTAASGRDGAPSIVWDSIMEWSSLKSSTGARSPIRTRSGRTAPAEGEESRHRVAVTEEDLETSYFRPPLQRVSKQMNPLSTATDRRVAPAGGTSPARRRKRKSDGEDEDRRMERILVRLLPRLLMEMGVVPTTASAQKARNSQPPAQPAKKATKVAPKAGWSAPNAPPPAASRDRSPPASNVPQTARDGARPADDNEATWAQIVSRVAKRAAAKAEKKNETAPPKSAKAPAATAPKRWESRRGSEKGERRRGPQSLR